MSDSKSPATGGIGWVDLTVKDAETVRDFYSAVAGWRPEPVDMGGYADFNMLPAGGGAPVAGICHARGTNAALPAQWLIYIIVADVRASAARCEEKGGKVISRRLNDKGPGGFVVIQDPAGAVCGLYQPA